jgi:hypothetical protein
VELHQEGRLPKRIGRAPRIEIDPPKPARAKTARAKSRVKAKTGKVSASGAGRPMKLAKKRPAKSR